MVLGVGVGVAAMGYRVLVGGVDEVSKTSLLTCYRSYAQVVPL